MPQETGAGVSRPARNAVEVDVSSTDHVFTAITAGIYVGGAGVLEVDMAGDGLNVEFTVPAGALLPIQCRKVLTANTTATGIVGLF